MAGGDEYEIIGPGRAWRGGSLCSQENRAPTPSILSISRFCPTTVSLARLSEEQYETKGGHFTARTMRMVDA